MGEAIKLSQEVEKPQFLYHASPHKNIEIFEPRAESYRDPGEGPVVFATPSETYASMFIVPTKDDWSRKGRHNSAYYTVINNKEKFEQIDKGGSIYALPSQTFTTDTKRSMGTDEWVSRVPVKPEEKKEYQTGLEAMLEHGVQVYFVDKATWQKIIDSKDHGLSILLGLQSENQKKGSKYRFPTSIRRSSQIEISQSSGFRNFLISIHHCLSSAT